MRKIDWEILVNHLSGVSSESEEKELAEWISRTEENRKWYEHLKMMWTAERRSPPKPDTEKALGLVLSRIRQSSVPGGAKVMRFVPSSGTKWALDFVTRPRILRVAAAIAVAAVGISLFAILTLRKATEMTTIAFNTMQTIKLPDGTRATFDVGSTLAYDRDFGNAGTRDVFLDGEAYFEVARNDKSPFVIHAGIGRIEVLGTKFNVRAWKRSKQVIVAVQEGKVSFQKEGNRDTSGVVYLTRSTVSRLAEGQSPSPPEDADIARHVSWMKREIYFQNTPVPEVLTQLERWYRVTIETADSSMLKSSITIFIENKPLIDNLNLISVMMNTAFVQKGDTVRFVPQ